MTVFMTNGTVNGPKVSEVKAQNMLISAEGKMESHFKPNKLYLGAAYKMVESQPQICSDFLCHL